MITEYRQYTTEFLPSPFLSFQSSGYEIFCNFRLSLGPERDTSLQSPPHRVGFISPAQPSRSFSTPTPLSSHFSGPEPFHPHFHNTNTRARQTTWKPGAKVLLSSRVLMFGGMLAVIAPNPCLLLLLCASSPDQRSLQEPIKWS